MADSANMAEIMNRFMETSNLTIQPKETRVHRLIILRLLYSFGASIDISQCILGLKDAGVDIGMYNLKNTMIALKQDLTTMQIHEWLVLIEFVKVTSFPQIISRLSTHYDERLMESPIWRIHQIIKENTVLSEEKQHDLTVRVFILIYNCEIHTSTAISTTLSLFDQTSGMLYQIFGQMNTSISRDNIMFDVNIILQMMELKDGVRISERICNPTRTRHELVQYTRIHENLKCRPSLTQIREMVLSSRSKELEYSTGQSLGGDDKILVDLVLNNEVWLTKSATEKQIILLIVSMDSEKLHSKYNFISTLFGEAVDKSVDTCVVAPTRMVQISKHTILVMSKINNNVDMSDANLLKLMEQFSQDCFSGIFGILQQELMTVSFCVQMYIIAYIHADMQPLFYREVVFFFNKKIQNVHRELCISEYVSPQLLSNMAMWTTKHDFSQDCISTIFSAMTI